MHLKGYISEFLEYDPIEIDSTDNFYLRIIITANVNTSYKIHSFYKKWVSSGESYSAHTIAYKNVNKRVHRLLDAGLLEEIKKVGGNAHGAKVYRVTSRGLVYIISDGMPYFANMWKDDGLRPDLFEAYCDSALFKTFINPFFEKSTLLHSTPTLTILLDHYIQEICKNIRFHLSHENVGPYLEDGDFDPLYFVNALPMKELNISLNWCIRSLFIKILTMKFEFIDWQYYEKRESPPEEDKINTFYLLTRDRKFMKAIRIATKDFLKGYSEFMNYYQHDRQNPFIYRINNTDEWACKNCSITGDIWFMRRHNCPQSNDCF